MGSVIEVIGKTFQAFGVVGVCGVMGFFVAVAVVHSAMKKKDD